MTTKIKRVMTWVFISSMLFVCFMMADPGERRCLGLVVGLFLFIYGLVWLDYLLSKRPKRPYLR